MSVKQIKIAITDRDGGLTIKSFVVDDGHEIKVEPTPENIEKEIRKSRIDFVSWRIIKDDDIPRDRTYRNAWKDFGDKVDHDMPKARVIHLGKLRQERAMELEDLDKEWMKHTGQGNKKDASVVEAKRQELRDITDTLAEAIESAQTAEELKAAWPDGLIRRPVNFSVWGI